MTLPGRTSKVSNLKSSNLRHGLRMPSRVMPLCTYLTAALIQFCKCIHTSPISPFTQFVQLVPEEQQQKESLANEFKLSILNTCDVLIRSLLTFASSKLHKIKQRKEDVPIALGYLGLLPLSALKMKINPCHGTTSPCCISSST